MPTDRIDHYSQPVIELNRISYRYRHHTALHNVTFTVGHGTTVGLLGPNGAGKTTLLKLVQGVLIPSHGRIRLWGTAPTALNNRVNCGSTPQDDAIPESLTVAEAVSFVANHYPAPRPVPELLDRFKLGCLSTRRMSRLSGGQRRKVAVALAFVGRPKLVLLDEPTSGLDIETRREILAIIRQELSGPTAAIITSHYLNDIETLADDIVILQEGKLRHSASLADFLAHGTKARLLLRGPEPHTITTALKYSPDPVNSDAIVEPTTEGVRITTTHPEKVLQQLYAAKLNFTLITVERTTLEDAFIELIQTPSENS